MHANPLATVAPVLHNIQTNKRR